MTSLTKTRGPFRRSSKADLDSLLEEAQSVLFEYSTGVTIRHLFYRLTEGERVLRKTEAEYGKLCRHLAKWRRTGDIAYDAFVDGTRWVTKIRQHDSLDSALDDTARFYRRNLWNSQPHYVEIWCEKDAIKSILCDEASKFGVGVFACRGFASLTSLHQMSVHFAQQMRMGKQVHVFYFGDHDPSGLDIDRSAIKSLRDDFGVDDVDFRRVAVTPSQIEELDLPTRPAKSKDTRAIGWEGGCVEIDTLRPDYLMRLVSQSITSLIEPDAWRMAQRIEEEEREVLETMSRNVGAYIPSGTLLDEMRNN